MSRSEDHEREARYERLGREAAREGKPREAPSRLKYGSQTWHYWLLGYDEERKRSRP